MTEAMNQIWDSGMRSYQEAETEGQRITVSTHIGGRIILSVATRGVKFPTDASFHMDKECAEKVADLLAQATGNALYITDDDKDSEIGADVDPEYEAMMSERVPR